MADAVPTITAPAAATAGNETLTMTTSTMTTIRYATVRAYVDNDNSLLVQVHPCYPAEYARRATKAERDASLAAGDEGWIETAISARTLARLEAQAEG